MKAAFYESDITPPLGCYMTGYGVPRYAKDVHTRLSSKAVVFEDDGEYSVIISVDICEYPNEMHDICDMAKQIQPEMTGFEVVILGYCDQKTF